MGSIPRYLPILREPLSWASIPWHAPPYSGSRNTTTLLQKTPQTTQKFPRFAQNRSNRLRVPKTPHRTAQNDILRFCPIFSADVGDGMAFGGIFSEKRRCGAGSVGPYVHILPRLREDLAHIPDQDLESSKSIFLHFLSKI